VKAPKSPTRAAEITAVRSSGARSKAKTPKKAAPAPSNLEELFDRLRTGAANVAGVTFQVAVSALLLAAGRAGSHELPVASVRPEGMEDVDCELADGSLLLVQTKEHGVGARNIAAAEVAEIIAHAAYALTLNPGHIAAAPAVSTGTAVTGPARRFAVVTDGQFGSGLPTTGWTVTLADALAASPNAIKVTGDLCTPLRAALVELGLSGDLAGALLAHTHLVRMPADLSQQTIAHLESGVGLHPAVASMVRAEMLRDLGEMAARAREASLETAERRHRSDIDAVADQILQAISVADLEEAVRGGICEPASYTCDSAVGTHAFLRGVEVIPAHIAADLDVVRPEEIASILDGLAARQHVVIAGPSGSGKSALLWRAARTIDRGPRVVRVLSVASAEEATLLVRHVRRQRPSSNMPVLVCADNLGRARTEAWPQARDRLLELPGVMVLGAARHEDLTPSISSNAVVVDPRLTDSAAGEIYRRIEQLGAPTVLAIEEAVQRADGLLMEFIALVTAGKRLHEILAMQVAPLADTQRRLQREALRLVCAAHVLGFSVPADSLPPLLSAAPDLVGDALARLQREHLVTADGYRWHGLHDLRTEVLLELLHTAPPPTLSETYARALRALPRDARPAAARRAAARIAKQVAAGSADVSGAERLAAVNLALSPIVGYLSEQLSSLSPGASEQTTERASYAAGLLEAADRLDTVAFAHAVLADVEHHRPAALDPATTASLAYSIAIDGLNMNLDQLQPLVDFARSLPARTNDAARRVAAALHSEALVNLASAADLATAVRLCEAAEALVRLTVSQAQHVYRAHVATMPVPAGSAGTPYDADLRAQLTATLTALAYLHGPAVEDAFGPPLQRAEDAVASDLYGARVELAFTPPEPLHEAVANTARAATYDNERMLVARAVAFLRQHAADLDPSAYRTRPKEDPASVHGQTILLARRVFDACPEADVVQVEMWQANCQPIHVINHDEGVLTLRAGVLAREHTTSRNVAFQAAVSEALAASDWTTRLRLQAQIAHDLADLLRDLPSRLRANDNSRHRTQWGARVEDLAARVAALPRRPPVADGALRSPGMSAGGNAADADQRLRAPDGQKDVLEHITSCLAQVVRAFTEDRLLLVGAGSRLADAPALLDAARKQGAPHYASVGDTLPSDLDRLSALYGRLLTAATQKRVTVALRTRQSDQDLDALLRELAREASDPDCEAISALLADAKIQARYSVIKDPNPLPAWRDQCVLAVVAIDDWDTALAALQGWTEGEREQAGLSGRIVAIAVDNDQLLPVGMQVFGAIGHALLIPEDDFAAYRSIYGLPILPGPARQRINKLIADLVDYSYALVRAARRVATWHPSPLHSKSPEQVAHDTREQFAQELAIVNSGSNTNSQSYLRGLAAQCVLELCNLVAQEDGVNTGLAANSVDFDVTALATHIPIEATQLMAAAYTTALRAEAAVGSTVARAQTHT
jgi:hypothetical protein